MEELQSTIVNLRDQINELRSLERERLLDLSLNITDVVESELSSGDTAWLLSATVLVLGMTLPGIMLYYAGMVRIQNALSTAMQGYAIAAVITSLWLCFGYSLSFAPSRAPDINAVIFGDASRFWLRGIYENGPHQLAPTISETLFCSYQLAFAIITPTLICGAFADRVKFMAVLVTLGLWHLIVYCPVAHSNWHPDGFLHKAGVIDFAGGNVVHISAGTSALVSALIVGNRTGFGKTVFQPHNLLLSLVGEPCSFSSC
jgi:Amt family ammonium transporter